MLMFIVCNTTTLTRNTSNKQIKKRTLRIDFPFNMQIYVFNPYTLFRTMSLSPFSFLLLFVFFTLIFIFSATAYQTKLPYNLNINNNNNDDNDNDNNNNNNNFPQNVQNERKIANHLVFNSNNYQLNNVKRLKRDTDNLFDDDNDLLANYENNQNDGIANQNLREIFFSQKH